MPAAGMRRSKGFYVLSSYDGTSSHDYGLLCTLGILYNVPISFGVKFISKRLSLVILSRKRRLFAGLQ